MTRPRPSTTTPRRAVPRDPATAAARPARRTQLLTAGLVALVILGLFFAFGSGQSQTSSAVGNKAFQVGQPGPGQPAPPFTLPSSTGKTISLADYRGKNVLLFFQEGIGCQPCWDQIRDLEKSQSQLTAAGIDAIVSVTTSPVDLVAQKTRDDRLRTPVASDADLGVSRAYHANDYGMMGDSRDGHSFVLVGPDGAIRWRADYGGAPNYTMFLPVDRILADMRAAMTTRAASPGSP